jgi:hypothetical protein
MDPIGVGFIGQGEEGRFHLERFRLRTDCRCEAIWFSPKDLTGGNPTRLALHTVKSKHEIAANPSISLVVVDVPAADENLGCEIAADCLQHGQNVVIGVSAFPNPGALSQLGELARSLDRNVFVSALHRWESSFLGVQSIVASGVLGDLTRVRKISRQYVPEELSLPRQILPDARQALDRLWFEMLDELLLLVPEPMKLTEAAEQFFERSETRERVQTGLVAEFVFEKGCVAQLELDRRSLAPLETGWVLEGRQGGFVDRKRYRAIADFELVDVPVEFPVTNQDGFYDSVLATLRDRTPFPVNLDSMRRVLELLWECKFPVSF